ncbi:unnamed protein product [Camellia sinensis]
MKHGYSEIGHVCVSDTYRIRIRARYARIRIRYGKWSIRIFFLIFEFRIRLGYGKIRYGYGMDTVWIRRGQKNNLKNLKWGEIVKYENKDEIKHKKMKNNKPNCV